ncbi:hypothetical protein MHI18_06195 [Peribacillus sp. FSL H8-0477]|uniref:hypothetical protein n=1 Tax=Peribacillus sp. FSL H8-0477 TaxID=2921388 RepID=UPI0030FC5F10
MIGLKNLTIKGADNNVDAVYNDWYFLAHGCLFNDLPSDFYLSRCNQYDAWTMKKGGRDFSVSFLKWYNFDIRRDQMEEQNEKLKNPLTQWGPYEAFCYDLYLNLTRRQRRPKQTTSDESKNTQIKTY